MEERSRRGQDCRAKKESEKAKQKEEKRHLEAQEGEGTHPHVGGRSSRGARGLRRELGFKMPEKLEGLGVADLGLVG